MNLKKTTIMTKKIRSKIHSNVVLMINVYKKTFYIPIFDFRALIILTSGLSTTSFLESSKVTTLLVNRLKINPKLKAMRVEVMVMTLYGMEKSGVAKVNNNVDVLMI